jgi:hypothetical protein
MHELITDAELARMARRVTGTAANPHQIAKAMYQKRWRPEDMQRIRESHGIMRCEFCEAWKAPGLELVEGCCPKCAEVVLCDLKAAEPVGSA